LKHKASTTNTQIAVLMQVSKQRTPGLLVAAPKRLYQL
jgi:hypothetical protein